ncbi:MAG: polysaccharide pyruvyl transferase family protein, partial [Clostridia bacterium]|nr:polysaccharide pyruvyl transferase family protein [Clostridia bacterium]
MKYGVLWRKTTKNIGDDVQSYAASLWLPSVDYMVDIEDMEHFTAENDEPVATIMSAWYMWHKWYWPPSKHVYPLWIGFHYNDILRGRPRGMQSRFEYVDNGPGWEYLKNYEPIGCRDYYTQGVLDNMGIKNYYSGCVTLT